MTRRALAAPDKFRGTAGAHEIAAAIAKGAANFGLATDERPLADGGEGLLDAVGGTRECTEVAGPLGGRVAANWRRVVAPDGAVTAVIEMAQAAGLALVGGAAGNDPGRASTEGVGELVAAAVSSGATRVVIGCGGSATTDGGLGLVEALAPRQLEGVELLAAVDVTTPFLEAASRFGPQKGATPLDVEVLSRRLEALAARYDERFGVDVTALPGAGAAGGLAGGVAALGGAIVSGFDLVAGLVGLDEALDAADVVITGEGKLDPTSLEGKVVSGVLRRARRDVPVLVVAGAVEGVDVETLGAATGHPVRGIGLVSLVARFGLERALGDTTRCVEEAVTEALTGPLFGPDRPQ